MEVKIESKKNNKLFNRIEVSFLVSHENKPTPTRNYIRQEIAKQLKKDENLIVVQVIRTGFGLGKSVGEAHVYDDKETMLKNEPKYLLLRNKLIKKEEKEEKTE